jgi:hypothetical protein
MEGRRQRGARAGLRQLFIGKWEERREARASNASTLSRYGGATRGSWRRQRRRLAALAIPQAAWHSGKAPAEEARAVEERWGDTWAREEQEVDGGGQEWRTAPAAGEPEEQSRGAEVQGGRREKEGAED